MGLLSYEERTQLIAKLLKIPLVPEEYWRHALTVGLPDGLRNSISGSHVPLIHVTGIMDTVNEESWIRLSDGTGPVIRVVENILAATKESALELLEALQRACRTLSPSAAQLQMETRQGLKLLDQAVEIVLEDEILAFLDKTRFQERRYSVAGLAR